MSVEEEDTSLKDLVTKTLQNNGVLGKIQAQLRASVFLALEEEFKEKDVPLVSPSVKQLLGTREGALAAALVQDFLQSLNLDFSLAVFAPESGHSALWSFPGKDAVMKDLKLNARKDDQSPLLLEILRERESPRLSKSEGFHKPVENQPVGDSSQKIGTFLNDSKPLTQLTKLPFDTIEQNKLQVKKLPLDTQDSNDSLKNGDGSESKSLESQSGGETDRTTTKSRSLEDDKDMSEGSLAGFEKQYEEDFSSMSEKDGQGEAGEEENEEEIEDDEDIEEDISDLLNSSISLGTDNTKDQSLSQVSDAPNYQEDL